MLFEVQKSPGVKSRRKQREEDEETVREAMTADPFNDLRLVQLVFGSKEKAAEWNQAPRPTLFWQD